MPGRAAISMDLSSVGRWVLIAVVGAFALIGFLQLTRGTAVRHVRDVAHETPVAVSDPRFALSVTLLTGAWLAPGNRVEVMLNGDGTYSRLWQDLQSAQQSITLQLYYKNAGEMTNTLGRILVDRARAGVRVLLLYDAFGASDIPCSHLDVLRVGECRSSRSARSGSPRFIWLRTARTSAGL
jgi:phosphatidylserine/phosphatidylglycerophosphate/cardiolipin synthase-like enzyme